jgi:hypothetical protein
MKLWKGILESLKGDPDVCDAEMKVGMQLAGEVRCELRRNHLGHHRNLLTTWARTPEEMRAHIAELNRREGEDR